MRNHNPVSRDLIRSLGKDLVEVSLVSYPRIAIKIDLKGEVKKVSRNRVLKVKDRVLWIIL